MSPIVHPFREGAAERTTFGYRTQDHPGLDRIQNAVSAVAGTVAAVAVVVMVALTLLDVALRTFFGAPIGWSVAFIELYLLPIAAFFGIVVAYRSGAHVAVTSLYERFPIPVRKAMLIIGYLVLLIGLAALFWAGLQATLFAISTGEGPVPGSSELPLPGWLMRAIVPVATGLGLVLVLIDLGRELAAPWTATATDYDPGDEASRAVAEAEAAFTNDDSTTAPQGDTR
ncbi:TRAP transporter small permease [Tsukamurella sp. NPDC003166]|uniref:TRAP transporter small permease n=1 Tax=Tsukamurella sp. NPDC003166 TaxID=3154444 RepID=UPI0033B83D37